MHMKVNITCTDMCKFPISKKTLRFNWLRGSQIEFNTYSMLEVSVAIYIHLTNRLKFCGLELSQTSKSKRINK